MKMSPKIVVIHDDLIPKVDPLLVQLSESFGKENVIHFVRSNEGLEYVLNNLNQKMIVILDINFSSGEINGVQVLEKIRSKTSLVFVIMITARTLRELSNDFLISMVNNDALAVENADDYSKIVSLVINASDKLEVNIDSVIEEWIMKHPVKERNQSLVKLKDGKSYSMNEILESIRKRTTVGIDFEKNLLRLSIELFSRQKLKLND
jgi:hypothetical protein